MQIPSDISPSMKNSQLAQIIIESKPGSLQSTATIETLLTRNRHLKLEAKALLAADVVAKIERNYSQTGEVKDSEYEYQQYHPGLIYFMAALSILVGGIG